MDRAAVHVLLGLGSDANVMARLHDVGIDDIEGLVDAAYPHRWAGPVRAIHDPSSLR